MRPLYIAATGQHIGKTTSTLGITMALRSQGINVGYCKPVGQKHVQVNGALVDKDVKLFSQILKFNIEPTLHSPVILHRGATAEFIDHPDQFSYEAAVEKAASTLMSRHELMVFEGTGHPGVGSVVDLSNADVAKMIGADVVLVVQGGIGKTIDEMSMSLAKFRAHNVPVVGVIVNKVLPEKMDKIGYYLSKKLQQLGLPLLGQIPYDKTLSHPIIETIIRAVNGKVLFNEHRLANRVEQIIAGSLVDKDEFSSFRNILLVVSPKRLDYALGKIQAISKQKELENVPLSGIIITGDGRHAYHYNISKVCQDYIDKNEIPVLTTELDTFGSVVKISRIEVKINTKTPWKTRRAIELIREYVDLGPILV